MADISILGRKVSPWAAGAVGVGGVAVTWYAIRQHQASSAASAVSSPASSSAIDPVTQLPYSQDNQVDPATNMTYLQEAEEYGSVAAAEQAMTGAGIGAAGYYGAGYPYGNYAGVPQNITTVSGTEYATNAAWAQAVEAGLTDIGYSSTDVASALGRYLGRLPETSAQAGIVQAAIAEYGPPPVGTYTVIMQSSTGSTGSGNTGSGTSEVTVPNVEGVNVEQATQIIEAAGLKASGPKGEQGVSHVVTSTSPEAGAKVKHGSTVTLHYRSEHEQTLVPSSKPPIITPGR